MKNLKGLQAFAHIMNLGTLAAAAKRMHSSESALSRQLALCEQELGLTLFSRDNRSLTPTKEGKAFYNEAERILLSLEQIPNIARGIKKEPLQRIRVVSTHRSAAPIAIPAVEQFSLSHPEARVSFETHQIKFLERWIASNQFDIGISNLPTQHHDIDYEPICQAKMVAMVPTDHPLAQRSEVSMQDLAKETLILPSAGTAIREIIDTMFEEQTCSPLQIPIQVNQVLTACLFIKNGLGVTICDELISYTFLTTLKKVPITPYYTTTFGLLFPKDVKRSDQTHALAQHIRQQVDSLKLT